MTRAVQKKLPSHPRRLWFSTFSQLWGTSSTSMPRRFGCCVSVSFEFPSCFRISWLVPPCRTASLCISLSLESRLLSVSLPCGFGVSWRSGHVSCFAGKLACCCCSYMRLLLLPHHDYDYDDYNNCYLLLLLLLFLLLQMMILDPTSNYDDGDADSTKQLKVTLFASLQ